MRIRILLTATVAAWPLLSGTVTAQQSPSAERVLARVNGQAITLGAMIAMKQSLPEQYQQLPAEQLFEPMLNQLVQQSALAQSFEGKAPALLTLKVENYARELTAAEAVQQAVAQGLSEEDILAAYEERYAQGTNEKEFNAAHILVETEEDALAIKVELDAGADFAEMARARSTGPSGPRGGALGWFGPGMMVPEFEQAVVAMQVSEVSAPVKTQFGWHLIKLNETRILKAPTLEEVRDELTQSLRRALIEDHIGKVTGAAEVEFLDTTDLAPSAINDITLLGD